jgi:hypothetical protein
VPLDCEAIGHLQNSALALDVYSWLAHRLWRVREGNGIDLSWAALKGQFGQEYRDTKNFKREFAGALQKAAKVYKDARIELVPGGVKLLPSPPPIKRRTVSVPAAAPEAAASSARERKKIVISVNARETARRLAPGWDKYALQALFLEWAENLKEPLRLPPDKAFLG